MGFLFRKNKSVAEEEVRRLEQAKQRYRKDPEQIKAEYDAFDKKMHDLYPLGRRTTFLGQPAYIIERRIFTITCNYYDDIKQEWYHAYEIDGRVGITVAWLDENLHMQEFIKIGPLEQVTKIIPPYKLVVGRDPDPIDDADGISPV